MQKGFPVRKHQRLKSFDYNSNGAYHITICVQNRREFLGRIVGRDALGTPFAELSEYGKIIYNEIMQIPFYYKNIEIDKFVIMPNHVHMIIIVKNNGNEGIGVPGASRPTAIIPNVVGILKRKTNKIYGFKMWQTGYYDHIIRDEADYLQVWQYIDNNPAKWTEDEYFTELTS